MLGIVAVVLATLQVGLDVLRRDQAHVMAKGGQLACPMVRAAARFHGNHGRRVPFEERHQLRAAEIDPQLGLTCLVYTVQGEYGLGRVEANATKLGHGRLRFWLLTTQFWHTMPWGRPPQHLLRTPGADDTPRGSVNPALPVLREHPCTRTAGIQAPEAPHGRLDLPATALSENPMQGGSGLSRPAIPPGGQAPEDVVHLAGQAAGARADQLR